MSDGGAHGSRSLLRQLLRSIRRILKRTVSRADRFPPSHGRACSGPRAAAPIGETTVRRVQVPDEASDSTQTVAAAGTTSTSAGAATVVPPANEGHGSDVSEKARTPQLDESDTVVPEAKLIDEEEKLSVPPGDSERMAPNAAATVAEPPEASTAPGADALASVDPMTPTGPPEYSDEPLAPVADQPTGRRSVERMPVRVVSAPAHSDDRAPPEPSAHLPAAYLAWNRALTEYCLLRPLSNTAYLTVTPPILAAAWLDAFHEAKAVAHAETEFIDAVAATYRNYVLAERDGLWALAHVGDDHIPDCTAFLALSVLAAYEMHADEEAGPNAFYKRLAELLDVDVVGRHPRGFTTRDFRSLWQALEAWIVHETDSTLAMPVAPGTKPFIALPLTHVPLRRVDTEKLPDFFSWAGYEPGSRLSLDVIERDLLAWQRARSQLSRVGVTALADHRRPAVAAQVALELEAWDGASGAGPARRAASVHVYLDFPRRQPLLQYLARRPPGFPRQFDDGAHAFEAAEEGWYDPVLVPVDGGSELHEGFTWAMTTPTGVAELHRPPATVIALAPARDTTGYLSRQGLIGGVRSAVLCREERADAVEQYLSFVAERRCQAVRPAAVPDGWCLFPTVLPSRLPEVVPGGLEALAVSFGAEIIVTGGLRIARGAVWLAGAAPTVLLGGNGGRLVPRVDGDEVEMSDDGALNDGGRLDAPGLHVVEAGAARRRIEVIEPDVNTSACATLAQEDAPHVVALPPGDWIVVGAQTDEVAQALDVGPHGALARADFDPQWAISIEHGLSTVLCLSERPGTPTGGGFNLTAAQFHALDELVKAQPGACVVGIAGDAAPGSHGWPPIIRYASGDERVLNAEGRLVAFDALTPMPHDAPQLKWASAIEDAGTVPGRLGAVVSGLNSANLRESWTAYHTAAHELKHHWSRSRQ